MVIGIAIGGALWAFPTLKLIRKNKPIPVYAKIGIVMSTAMFTAIYPIYAAQNRMIDDIKSGEFQNNFPDGETKKALFDFHSTNIRDKLGYLEPIPSLPVQSQPEVIRFDIPEVPETPLNKD